MKALTLAVFAPLLVHGFSNTAPIVAWSRHRSAVLEGSPRVASANAAAILDDIISTDTICQHDAVLIVEQPNLLASDLRSLPSSSGMSRMLSSCKSSRQYPYARRDVKVDTLSLSETLATKCGSRLLTVTLDDDIQLHSSVKHVIHMSMLPNDGMGDERHAAMAHHDRILSSTVESISSVMPDYLAVLVSSDGVLLKRADGDAAVFESSGMNGALTANSTLPAGGILKRYQLLTPGLILTLLIAFFVLAPILLFGISALSSIQSSVRLDAPKGYDAQEKKNH